MTTTNNPIALRVTAHPWTNPDDEVLHLRAWGTDTIHPLPAAPPYRATIGTDPTCGLRLHDASGRTAPVHAVVTRDQIRWLVRDLHSADGMKLDGVPTAQIWLEPGDEITIGDTTLIAESARTVSLRSYLCRLLGWSRSRAEAVDLALRSLRMAGARQGMLALCGSDDLVPTARALHRRMNGADRPFIVCDPAGSQLGTTIRPGESRNSGMAGAAAAADGSLCVRRERLPEDFPDVISRFRHPRSRFQLVVCTQTLKHGLPYLWWPICLPPLVDRVGEIDRVITEYALDAFAELDVRERGCLPPEDHDWVRRSASSSLAAVEKATQRLVALRISDTLDDAAALLGIPTASLERWVQRRKVPLDVACSCCTAERRATKTQRSTGAPGLPSTPQ